MATVGAKGLIIWRDSRTCCAELRVFIITVLTVDVGVTHVAHGKTRRRALAWKRLLEVRTRIACTTPHTTSVEHALSYSCPV